MVRALAHGAMGRRINPSWGVPIPSHARLRTSIPRHARPRTCVPKR